MTHCVVMELWRSVHITERGGGSDGEGSPSAARLASAALTGLVMFLRDLWFELLLLVHTTTETQLPYKQPNILNHFKKSRQSDIISVENSTSILCENANIDQTVGK